jgi:hypothetical protein
MVMIIKSISNIIALYIQTLQSLQEARDSAGAKQTLGGTFT